jgi:hypothetical protein
VTCNTNLSNIIARKQEELTISDDLGWNPTVKPLNTLGPLLAQGIASSTSTLTKKKHVLRTDKIIK